jgi:hypothetical protein
MSSTVNNRKSNPRNFRFGDRKKRRKRTDQHKINLRDLKYFRSTVLPDASVPLGLAVEKINCRKTGKSLPFWVALCVGQFKGSNKANSCIYSSKIYYNERDVRRDEWNTGFTTEMLANGRKFFKVKEEIRYFLEKYLVIGSNLDEDLKLLELYSYRDKCLDIQGIDFYAGKHERSIKLRTLAFAILNKRIERFDPRKHMRRTRNPVVTARTIIELYHWKMKGYAQPKIDGEGEKNFEFTKQKVRQTDELRAIEEREIVGKGQRRRRLNH